MRCDQGLFGTEIPAVGTGKQAWLHSEPHFPLLAPSIAKDQSPMAVCEGQVQRWQVSVHLGVNVRDQGCALERRDIMPPPAVSGVRLTLILEDRVRVGRMEQQQRLSLQTRR